LFGAGAGIVFVITLLSSGISSSIVGTLAGQAVKEGLLGMKVNIWLRRIVTRFINVIPTTIALLLGPVARSSQYISLQPSHTQFDDTVANDSSSIIDKKQRSNGRVCKRKYHNNNFNYFCWNNISI